MGLVAVVAPNNSYNSAMDTFKQTDTHVRAIADYLAAGSNTGCEHCLGFELEHFIVETGSHRLVPYLSSDASADAAADASVKQLSVRDILMRLSEFYDEQTYETQPESVDYLIGLSRPKVGITLEPGAQLEISIGPADTIEEIEHFYLAFRSEIDPILQECGYELLTLGYHPTACAFEIPLIPKARYRHMDHHFQQTGAHGICMMRASASTQVSIDYSDEQDCVRKFRISNSLGPLLAFVTDNSPIFEATRVEGASRISDTNSEGKLNLDPVQIASSAISARSGLPVPQRMVRTVIWDDVDAARSMTAPHTFAEGFGYASYAAALLAAPAIFRVLLDDKGETCPTCGLKSEYTGFESFGSVFADTTFTKSLIEHILSLFFYDIRLKGYLEIRIADSLPLEYALAFTALIKGVFYNDEALDHLENAFKTVDAAAIAAAKSDLRQDGYQATVYQRRAADWLDELLELALSGLPPQERSYLEPIANLISARQTLID